MLHSTNRYFPSWRALFHSMPHLAMRVNVRAPHSPESHHPTPMFARTAITWSSQATVTEYFIA